MFEPTKIIKALKSNQTVFEELLSGQDKAAYTWRPQANKWNLLEIVCHLRDEEVEDFRARTTYALTASEHPFPPIDPQGWVTSRNYDAQDYPSVLIDFVTERGKSIDWLESLESPNWENEGLHFEFGKMRAAFFLSNWLAHDYLHIRQILQIQYAYLQQSSGQSLSYAGGW